jgi:hypothetical protein
LHGVIDPFYRDVEAADRQFAAGHIWNDQPVYLPPRHALKITRVDRHDDTRLEFRVGGRTDDMYDHAPVHSLKLESNEAAVLTKSKKNRPVIVLGGTSAAEPIAGTDRATHADTAICVPVYGGDQFTSGMRERMRAYEFANIFYLPVSDCRTQFDEGFANFNHAQPIPRSLMRRHRGLALSEDALQAIHEWYLHFITGRSDPDSAVMMYRHEELARLASEN